MARTKRRQHNKELRDLKKIERLLENHQKEVTQNNQRTEPLKVEMKTNAIQTSSWIDRIILNEHSEKRSKERFNLEGEKALEYFRSLLKRSRKICRTVSEDGGEAILYAIGRNAIYVSLDRTEIKTVKRQENVTYQPIKNMLISIHEKELRKLNRSKGACEKRLRAVKLEANVEISQLQLKIHKTRSDAVRMASQAKINALNIHIKEKEQEIRKLETEIRRVSNSMVSVV